ncbi:MAG TPA: phosphate acyltransferase PlsX [Planctomycetaceae bacterium]|nr:phosphate acyltransferase PlsX [Planctomycetaceae bacterium]
MRIALDAMGGDVFPAPNVEGAIAALREFPHLEVLLVGDVPMLEPLVAEAGPVRERLHLHPAEGWIEMSEKPTDALRKKPNCSMAVCWKLMAAKEVDAVVSAGHTGAMVAAGLRTRLFLPGVKRPGIAVPMPTLKGRAVLMDVGANPAARPEHLLQYAVMGSIYAREILGVANPTVGLMNIGSEDGKGNDLVRDTQLLLDKCAFQDRYIGNVEGRDLYHGSADVVICEGFVGNVLLKAAEGMADMFLKTIAHELSLVLQNEKHLAKQAFENLDKRYQYHEAGGAPLLGIDGVCIICHGSSNARSIFNALRVAMTHKDRRINEQIVEELAREEAVVAT